MLLQRIFIISKCYVLQNSVRNVCNLTHKCSKIDNGYRQKRVRVTILGADSPTGEQLSFLLKENPLISQLYLFGTSRVKAIAADLSHIDTSCAVDGYCAEPGLMQALRRADVVVLLGKDVYVLGTDRKVVFNEESKRVGELAEACTKYAPKAIIVVAAPPVSATTVLVAQLFKQTRWYHPARIVGSVALTQIRANSLAARFQDLDPCCVHVPLVGSPDNDFIVPLFSRATPIGLLPPDCDLLHEKMKSLELINPPRRLDECKFGVWTLSEAYSLNHLVTTIGLGLCGDSKAICAAYVRQNIIRTCTHLVSTVKFGPYGVEHNYGVPRLSRNELVNLEKTVLDLHEVDIIGKEMMKKVKTPVTYHISPQSIRFSPHSTRLSPSPKCD